MISGNIFCFTSLRVTPRPVRASRNLRRSQPILSGQLQCDKCAPCQMAGLIPVPQFLSLTDKCVSANHRRLASSIGPFFGFVDNAAQHLNCQRSGLIRPVDHRVAVRAQRNNIPDRIYFIALANIFQGDDMMNVNEVFSQVSVGFFEIESATLTDGT